MVTYLLATKQITSGHLDKVEDKSSSTEATNNTAHGNPLHKNRCRMMEDKFTLFLGNHFMPVVKVGMSAMFCPKAETKP